MQFSEQKVRPYWYNLLNHWVNHEENSGLTIPFIIGTKYEFVCGGKPKENEIELLFHDILSHDISDQYVGLTYCGSIRAYILTLVDNSELQNPYFTGTDSSPKLVLLEQVFGEQVTLEWIISFLNEEYKDPISKGRYSRKNTSLDGWENFDEKDIAQIKTSLNTI